MSFTQINQSPRCKKPEKFIAFVVETLANEIAGNPIWAKAWEAYDQKDEHHAMSFFRAFFVLCENFCPREWLVTYFMGYGIEIDESFDLEAFLKQIVDGKLIREEFEVASIALGLNKN